MTVSLVSPCTPHPTQLKRYNFLPGRRYKNEDETGQAALIKAKRKPPTQRSNGGQEGTRPDPRTWSPVRLFMTRNGRSDQIQYLHLTLRLGMGLDTVVGMGTAMGMRSGMGLSHDGDNL